MVQGSITHLLILGCGYVGSAVLEEALQRGWRITALTRNRAQAEILRGRGGVEVVVADLEEEGWHGAVGSPDAVVNCVSAGSGGLAGYERSYVAGMHSLLTWWRRHPSARLLYTSSTSVYSQSDGGWVDEDSPAESTSPTGRLLRQAEDILRQAPAPASSGSRIVLRLAGIYGPGRHHLLDQLRAGASVLPGSGDYHLNLIHRDDIASAILRALESPSPTPAALYNLSDGCPTPRREVATWLAERLGRAPPSFDPASAGPSHRMTAGPLPDRRIDSRRFRQAYRWQPAWPSFREGYAPLLDR